MIWSKEQDCALRVGWATGLPSRYVAAMVGAGVTASAVRGRARDLGLPMRGELMVWGGKYKGHALPPRVCKALPESAGMLAPDSRPVPFSERAPNACAFPVGDVLGGDLLVCGAAIKPGARRPYCAHHLTITTVQSHAA